MKSFILIYILFFSMGVYSQVKKTPMQRIKEDTELIENKLNFPGTFEVIYLDRGNAKSELEDYRGAILDYEKALSLMDNQCDFCISYIGNAKLKMGDYPGAIRAYTILIDKDSYGLEIDALYKRSFCKLKINDYRGVILDCNRLIELNPKDKNAYSYRASAFYHLHQLNDACLDWSKAGELGDDDAYVNIKRICN